MEIFDVVILGAGGSGMFCAIQSAQRGRKVALIDHSTKPGGKIIISGGGRCNFTNRGATFKQYVSENEHFSKSALSRFTPDQFIQLVEKHGIAYHERKHGQLFCDASASQLVDMLVRECTEAGAQFFLENRIESVDKIEQGFKVQTDQKTFFAQSLVIATGGLSLPKIGATGIGHEIAKQFGIRITDLAPALDGFVFNEHDKNKLDGFAGIALDAKLTCNKVVFRENLLFTHTGFSGPVSLQSSLYWKTGDPVHVDFLPHLTREELLGWFTERKRSKSELKNLLSELLPKRLAERFCELYWPNNTGLGNISNKDLEFFCENLQNWTFIPAGTVGYSKAEVTRGGVDTAELSSKTLEAKKVPGLYFIGEVVDVSGWLGGYNYQWAWASGWAAGQVC